jgi:toxin HigB-1
MNIRFNNEYLEKLFQNQAIRGKPRYSVEVILQFKKMILKLQFANNVRELHNLKGLNFEALKGDYKGFYSVRVDKKYRLIISIQADDTIKINDILVIEDLTNHYQ